MKQNYATDIVIGSIRDEFSILTSYANYTKDELKKQIKALEEMAEETDAYDSAVNYRNRARKFRSILHLKEKWGTL